MQLHSLIISALQETGRAVVPGWGTFEIVERSSTWNEATGTAFPRGKSVAFHAEHSTPSNLLVPVAKKLGGNLEAAHSWLRRKVAWWQKHLSENDILVLEGLGSFRKNGEFQPEQSLQFEANSFGLTAVTLFKVHEPSALEARMTASLKTLSEGREKALLSWKHAAAAAAVIALVALGIYQSSVTTQMAGWFVPTSAPHQEEIIDHVDNIVVESHSEQAKAETSEVEHMQEYAERISVEKTPEVADRSTPQIQANWSIVIGAFKDVENARNNAATYKEMGYDVHVIEGHLNKVTLGSFATREEAKEKLVTIKTEVNAFAWVCAL